MKKENNMSEKTYFVAFAPILKMKMKVIIEKFNI